jgi:hypothetical protein
MSFTHIMKFVTMEHEPSVDSAIVKECVMASKMLTGAMRVIGPLMAILLWMFVDPTGWYDSFAVHRSKCLITSFNPLLVGLGHDWDV